MSNRKQRQRYKTHNATESVKLTVLGGPDRSSLFMQSSTCFDDPTNWYNISFEVAKNDFFPPSIQAQVEHIERNLKGNDKRFDFHISGHIFAQLTGSDCPKSYRFSGTLRARKPGEPNPPPPEISGIGQLTVRVPKDEAQQARKVFLGLDR